MTLRAKIFGAVAALALASTATAYAQAETPAPATTPSEVKVVEETILIPSPEFRSSLDSAREHNENNQGKSPSFAGGSKSMAEHFTWGADAGTSIDMSATDMSTIDFNVNIGYKGNYVRFAGIGAGISTMVDNSSRFYPVYAMFRSSFSPQPRFCFLDLRAGVALCNLREIATQADFYGSLGLGITLASGKRFSSHIIAAYTFIPLQGEAKYYLDNLHFATLRLGVSF